MRNKSKNCKLCDALLVKEEEKAMYFCIKCKEESERNKKIRK